MQDSQAEQNKVIDAFLSKLLETYRNDPTKVAEADRPLVGKLFASQQKAQMIAGRLDQFRKQVDTLNQQIRASEGDLQQEVGKAAGLVDAILLMSSDSPAKGADPVPAPAPNRKARRASASKTRKGRAKTTPEKGEAGETA